MIALSDPSDLADPSDLLEVVASPRRREILRLVWNDELSAGAIHAALSDVSFAAISLQLGALRRAGLLEVRSQGRHRYYRARREAAGPIGPFLERLWSDSLWRLKLAAELEHSRRGPRPRRRGRRKRS
jgi:DNA-binding transcriptional ArsR family regulator